MRVVDRGVCEQGVQRGAEALWIVVDGDDDGDTRHSDHTSLLRQQVVIVSDCEETP